MRNLDNPILGKLNKKTIHFTFNNKQLNGLQGDSIGSALLESNIRTLRYDQSTGEPRGLFCGIGRCYECRVQVVDQGSVRACITPLTEDMRIESKRDENNEV